MNWILVGFALFVFFSVLQIPTASRYVRFATADCRSGIVSVSPFWLIAAWSSYGCLLTPLLRYLIQQAGVRDFGSYQVAGFILSWIIAVFFAFTNHSLLRAFVLHCRRTCALLILADTQKKYLQLRPTHAPGKSSPFSKEE